MSELPSLAGGLAAAVGLLNLFVSNKTRADVSELKASLIQEINETDHDTRAWAESEFSRKDVCASEIKRVEALASARR